MDNFGMREKHVCPKCKTDGFPIVREGRSLKWKCCGIEWDENEDFLCIACGKNLPGRFVFCSHECANKIEWIQ
jgi:hypothetical protein